MPGLNVVEGVMNDRPGFESNSSGKSLILEAPVYALFDRCIRENYTGDVLVRLGSKGGMGVVVELFDTVSKKRLVVERYRKHSVHGSKARMFVDGKDVTR